MYSSWLTKIALNGRGAANALQGLNHASAFGKPPGMAANMLGHGMQPKAGLPAMKQLPEGPLQNLANTSMSHAQGLQPQATAPVNDALRGANLGADPAMKS